MITIQPDDEFTLKVTGADLQAIMAGLGEIPHKIATPLEGKILKQLEEQTKKVE
jgi:hypothetical protein